MQAAGVPPAQVTVTCDRGLSSELSKLKYNGKSSPRAFIQRVREFIESRGIPSERILAFGAEIFVDDALHWFRAIRDEVRSWPELVSRLNDDFGVSDFDYRFLAEIRARTQGDKENITVYLSIMAGMFAQLNKRLTDEEQLEILLHNVRPCYASVLSSITAIDSVNTLRTLCKNYENIQSRLAHFHEPARATSHTLAPEFAYAHASSAQTYNSKQSSYKHEPHKSNSAQAVHAVKAVASDKPKRFCFRCRVDTHTLKNCKAERYLVCFKCGLLGFTIPTCPECNKNRPELVNSKN